MSSGYEPRAILSTVVWRIEGTAIRVTALDRYATASDEERSYGDLALTRVIIADTHLAERDLDGAAAAQAPLRELNQYERVAQLPTAMARTHRLVTTIAGTGLATSLLGDLTPPRRRGSGSARALPPPSARSSSPAGFSTTASR
ncbi:hypothetical protein [Actinokineospora globicatena]|uniref:Uncharacterized protein n=1 Tax=Actinokineospora globicatena TaxID=103729 RepID=A0A9W6V8F6_9PSEU|nr:hypothetical protein [Actinokineospora globicatena]GLW89898.1 hypothetical protein Aglo03_07140 [Actinokineospora globicatena]